MIKNSHLLSAAKQCFSPAREMAKASSLVTKTVRNKVSDESEKFKPEVNRYHLYASYACPWAQRALIVRSLKGLEKIISADILHWKLTPEGWKFKPEAEGCTVDSINGCNGMKEVYQKEFPDYSGKFTVPVLFDKSNKIIVNNKAKDIIRALGSAFNEFSFTDNQSKINLYPEDLRAEIDKLDMKINTDLAEGVYKVGRAITDHTRDKSLNKMFDLLDKLDEKLENDQFIFGDNLTETDVNLYTTLVRFDEIYVEYFKCNRKHISEYKNLSRYLSTLNSIPEFNQSTNFNHILRYHKNID